MGKNGSKLRLWCSTFACVLALLGAHGADNHLVDITYVESAVAKGAVCLDGSPPAYHLAPGSGSGVNNWLVHFEVVLSKIGSLVVSREKKNNFD
ncbi:hypothetical protein ZWY2020_021848 [Hordeum vulgare]|nr:hypothetical protein ZWY2020_021848 [Hordeum vulgare]